MFSLGCSAVACDGRAVSPDGPADPVSWRHPPARPGGGPAEQSASGLIPHRNGRATVHLSAPGPARPVQVMKTRRLEAGTRNPFGSATSLYRKHFHMTCRVPAHIVATVRRRQLNCCDDQICRSRSVSSPRQAFAPLCRFRTGGWSGERGRGSRERRPASKKRAGPAATGPASAGFTCLSAHQLSTVRLEGVPPFRPHQPIQTGAVGEVQDTREREDREG